MPKPSRGKSRPPESKPACTEGELVFRIAGLDPLPHVREGRVNEGVSLVAQVAAVRKLLVAEQQRLAAQAPLVMEGRDIGTVVFPQTPYKFYLDANAEVRAQRRSQQGETDVIQQRDSLDQQRTTLAADPCARRPAFSTPATPPWTNWSPSPCGISPLAA